MRIHARKLITKEVVIVSVLLICFAIQAISANLFNTETYDERFSHLRDGREYWKNWNFNVDVHHPPLLKLLFTAPLQLIGEEKLAVYDKLDNIQFNLKVLFWARLVDILLACLGGLLLYLFAKELYGRFSAYLALFLYSFCPNVIANACLITEDYGIAFFFLASVWSVYRYLKRPTIRWLVISGVLLGLSQMVKLTGLLLFPIYFLLFLSEAYFESKVLKGGFRSLLFARFLGFGVIIVLSLLVLNAGYFFDGTLKPLASRYYESDLFKSLANNTLIGHLPVPLPEPYVRGLDIGRAIFVERGWTAYLLGEYSNGGWWHYYAVGYLVKTPIPSIIILALSICLSLKYKLFDRKDMFVIIPAAVVFGYMSFISKLNIGVRYLLPVYVFAYIYSGKLVDVRGPFWKSNALKYLLLALCGWYAMEAFYIWPHNLSYFNEFAGGPSNGGEVLLDSNIDWGQNEWFIRGYIKKLGVPVVENPGCLFVDGGVIINLNYAKNLGFKPGSGCHDWLTSNYPRADSVAYTWWVYDVPPPVDSLEFGSSKVSEYVGHEVSCTNGCENDSSRPEQVYLKDASLTFDLLTSRGRDILMLDVLDDAECRIMDIYINGRYLGFLRGFGPQSGWYTRSLRIPESDARLGRVRVTLAHNDSQCQGWDVRAVRVVNPELDGIREPGGLDDIIRFGWSHRQEYGSHSVKCSSGCDSDPSRRNQIFLRDGVLSYGLNATNGRWLSFELLDNPPCRTMDVYVNGGFAGSLRGEGKRMGWYWQSLPLSDIQVNSGEVSVTLVQNSSDCDGWDIRNSRVS